MFLNFQAVIAALGPDAAFRIANETRPPGEYLWETFLPERSVWSYTATDGSMTVRSTMAGLVGQDSNYPPGGVVEVSTFLEQIAKIAIEVPLREQVLRQIAQMLMQLQITGQPTVEASANEVLNFLDKLVVQPLIDAVEWLRGQAMTSGAINWTFNRKDLVVAYGVPAANIFAQRTGTAFYGGSASAFWSDIQAARRILNRTGGVRAFVAHPDTIDIARYNPANAMIPIAEGDGGITFRRIITSTGQFTQDAVNDVVTLVPYGMEGEIINPATPNTTILVPFCPRGKISAIGNNSAAQRGFRVGQGSTDSPNAALELGYTHMGPTIEGGGRPGRWAQLFTPEQAPWEIRARGAENALPVLESPDKLVILNTAMA